MSVSRRRFLQQTAGAAAAFSMSPIFSASASPDGFLEIRAEPAKQKLVHADVPSSNLWTYNGFSPGPEIRVRKGGHVRVRLINRLSEPTSIHWHGIRIENAMDGVSGLTQEAVQPGETFEYEFIAPDAGTFWYHAHNKSWNQVVRGLYGPLIVEGDSAEFDSAHDLTLVIDDWRLNSEGRLDLASIGALMDWSHGGRLGNWVTVNGYPQPRYNLTANEPYRLRLINAANARTFDIDPARFDAKVLAYDGQPLPEPKVLDYSPLLIGPSQRVDLLLNPKPGKDLIIEDLSGRQPFPITGFRVSQGAEKTASVDNLLLNELPEPNLEKAKKFGLLMNGGAMSDPVDVVYKGRKLEGLDFRNTRQAWAFNGIANLAEQPFFQVQRNESVLIEAVNDTTFLHAMHVHGHHFRIIEREGSTIDEGQPWRDTFLIGPGQTTRIAFVADNPGKWLLHCHMLEHAAAGMNTWFAVV